MRETLQEASGSALVMCHGLLSLGLGHELPDVVGPHGKSLCRVKRVFYHGFWGRACLSFKNVLRPSHLTLSHEML